MIAHALDSLLNLGSAPETSGWPAGTRLLSTARGTLRVLDTGGKGPIVLMVPDGPNVIEHHLPVIERLSLHARVICFDLPGFGFSRPKLGYAHRLEDAAAIVLVVMDALAVKEASLFFSCANGFYAIAAAKLAPQRIRRLLLCQTPSMEAMRTWTQRSVPKPIRTPVLGQLLMRASRRKFADIWYQVALPDKGRQHPQFKQVANLAFDHGGCFCLAGVVQGLSHAREDQLSGVRQPTTLLWGDADRSHKYTRAESMLELLPQAQIRHFPGCGHFPDLEQPEVYAGIALAELSA